MSDQKNNSQKILLVHFRYASLIMVGVGLVFLAANIATTSEIPSISKIISLFGWVCFYGIPLYVVNAFINYKIRFENASGWKEYVGKFIQGIVLSILVSAVIGSILLILNLMIEGSSFAEAIKWFSSSDSPDDIQRIVWISASIACVMYILTFIQYYQQERLKQQKQKVVQISTEHESLKSQIGPHFLFNSLNVLNGLISENQDKAQEFVGELSSVYRYVLEQKDKTLVSLKEELDFSRIYMNLVQKRFEDGLEFELIETFPDDVQIVPLSLQLLLENCIKHNRISQDEPLKIRVYIQDNYLVIQNNLQIKSQLQKSTGKGLKNIHERYAAITNKKVEVEKSANEFFVKIPLLNKKIITMEINQKYTKEEYKEAKKRVEEIQGFYWNFASYIIVNGFLTFLDLRDGEYNWAYWPLAGWAIGVFFHAIEVFGFFNSSSWKDRMVKKELEKRQREREEFNSKYSK